ncbi:MAG: hypothetical protein IJB74_09240 [Clostridia bacterium]|nr:hypothetical protein [Clostridia bacterium]
MDEKQLKIVAPRVTRVRQWIIANQPFYGRLLMRLPIRFGDCKTAYTDMKKIVFDPVFAVNLCQEEITFVLLHELMHCVLKHCTRGRGKIHFVYNIACDIVVNSIILDSMGKDEIIINGKNAMHRAPDGKEGRLYSADEIYKMLMENGFDALLKIYADSLLDSHDGWDGIADGEILEQIWNGNILAAASKSGGGVPAGLERVIKDLYRSPKIDWKQILHDFIQQDKSDFTFMTPDRRFQGDILMPSFQENIDGEAVNNLWFVIDTSASITDKALSEAYAEIKDAIRQMSSLSGFVSFFDCEITAPEPFETKAELDNITPIGGGGTSFSIIFEKMKEFFEEKPEYIIILTDGEAYFPKEEAADGVPVLWIMIDSEIEAPWGKCTAVYTD